ncbi:MAG: hypothetical protein DHS20C09_07650 [marine bacterium B5-7]|nr:MAG: hypothetical protein DHS20C09_07650 [marine bacterium B5-7]
MNGHNEGKLNQLLKLLPEGLLVDASWLEERGYYRSLRSHYVAAGWLKQSARGVFRRPRGELGWEQVVISLQILLNYPVSIGGRTALEQQGYAHYLSQNLNTIHLYSDVKLPSWIHKLGLKQSFVVHNRLRILPTAKVNVDLLALTQMYAEKESALKLIPWGQWQWPMVVSTPERAFLELLDELPQKETFHLADVTMEGLSTISPRRMQSLLETTKSIKVKRLFFFFADRHHHRWLNQIDKKRIKLGKGKRMLVKGGKYLPEYQITVPETYDEEYQDGI